VRKTKSSSAHHTSKQLKEIIADEKKTNYDSREVQDKVDGEENLHQENTSSVQNTVLNTNYNQFERKCLEEAVRQLNAHSIRQSTDYHVSVHTYSIPSLPTTEVLVHLVWAIRFIVRRWE
jgi:hypothetical protein